MFFNKYDILFQQFFIDNKINNCYYQLEEF